MSEEPNKITEADLHAYLDGFLADHRRAEVEAWLDAHPQEAERLDSYRQIDVHLHALFSGVLEEPLPQPLTERLGAPRSPSRPIIALRWKVMVPALALMCGLVFGWLGRGFTVERDTLVQSLVRDAVGAHHVFSSDGGRPVEIDASREKELFHWLSDRLGGEVRAPDLGPLGYRLLGGRLLAFAQGPAAQFMYQDSAGRRLTLFVVRTDTDSLDTPIGDTRRNAYRAFYWIDGNLGCVLTGDAGNHVLKEAAKAAYQQLVED